MVFGVKNGYEKKLEVVGVGYLAAVNGKQLQLRVGYANEIHKLIPDGLEVTCPDQTHVVVKGPDKQQVGQFAAEVRAARKPEPYKGKGVRYDGEHVSRSSQVKRQHSIARGNITFRIKGRSMDKRKFIGKQRLRRRNHVRNRLRGTADRPRMSVFRSHKHIYCQVIDDIDGKTIAAASTRDANLRDQVKYGGNKDAAQAIGKAVAEKVLASGCQGRAIRSWKLSSITDALLHLLMQHVRQVWCFSGACAT